MKDSSLIRKLQNLTRISRQNQLIRPRRRQRTDTGLSRQQIRQRSGLVIVKTQCKKCVGRNLYPHRLFAFIEIHDNQYLRIKAYWLFELKYGFRELAYIRSKKAP